MDNITLATACIVFIVFTSGCFQVPRHPEDEGVGSLVLYGSSGGDSVVDVLQDGVMLDSGEFVRTPPTLPKCKTISDCHENYCKLNDRIEFYCEKGECKYTQKPCPPGTVCTETETDSALDDLEGRMTKLKCVPTTTSTTSTTTTTISTTSSTLGDLGPCDHTNLGLFSKVDPCWMCSRYDALDPNDSYYFWLYIQHPPD